MSFLAPIAGLIAGAIGTALVFLFWMLKLRRKPVRVSSTMLWQRAVRDLEGNVPWQRVRLSFLLLLPLLAVILLAIAIARPVRDAGIGEARYGGEIAILIDTSASMNTINTPNGSTRLDKAKSDAIDLVRTISGRSSATRFRVIRAGGVPRIVSSGSGSWRQARAAIQGISGSDAPTDLVAAVELARTVGSREITEEGRDEREVHVMVFSDRASDSLPAEFSGSISLYQPVADSVDELGGNLGITLAAGQRDQTDPDRCRIFVTVAGVVDSATGVRVQARLGDRVLARKAIELVPDEPESGVRGVVEGTATLSMGLEESGLIEVSIMRDDALMSDNTAWISMPDPSPIVTSIIAPDGVADPLLVDVIRSVTGGGIAVAAPGEPIASGTGLVIYDRVDRDPRVQSPTIEIGAGERSGSTLERVLSWDRSHPVLRDVDLGGLRYSGLGAIEGEPLASGRLGAVITEQASGGVRHLFVGFAIEDSNWGVQISMPMFFTNAVRHLLPGTSGSGTVHHTGEPIGESRKIFEEVGLVDLDGQAIGISLLNAEQTIRAGTKMIQTDRSNAGGGSAGARMDGRVELWRWFVLAGLCILTLEWIFDLARRRLI